MSFLRGAQSHDQKPRGGFLRRKKMEPENELPEMDIEGGVNRAMRMAGVAPKPAGEAFEADHLRHALAAIEAALFAIDQTRDIIEEAYEVVLSAQETDDDGGRALLAESYDELRLSIASLVDNLDDRAASLIGKGHRQMDVKLGGKAHYSISSFRLDVSDRGLDLSPPRDAFSTTEEIEAVLAELDNALAKADRAANSYCRDAQFLINRMKESAAA